MAKIGLSSPWVVYYREVNALFGQDPEIHVVFDEDKNELKLFVDNSSKAEALRELLPVEKEFGNVVLKIDIIPSNRKVSACGSVFGTAFANNPILSEIKVVSGIFTNDIYYVIFVNKVVQYFNDSLEDANGVCSTLYQDIAKRIFENHPNVFFCTELW